MSVSAVGATLGIALLLPVTFYLAPDTAIIMLAGTYYGGEYGGSVTSILVNLPGSPSSAVTCIDGYQMAKRGRAGVMLSKAVTLGAALNGNGPVRASTYRDEKLRARVPYADEVERVKVARIPLPAFDEASRAGDISREEAEAAVLGLKTPEAAMASVVQRVKPLLPA